MVMVTHDAQAASIADRVLFLADGRSSRSCRGAARRDPRDDGSRSEHMIRAELGGLLGRKLRTILTAVAIILGVAMVSGTFVLTDSIDKAFNSIFTDSRQGSDAVITGKAATATPDNGSTAPTISESLLAKVQALPDVAAAEGNVGGEAHLIGPNGKAIVFGGAPNLGFSIPRGASRVQSADARRRRLAARPTRS